MTEPIVPYPTSRDIGGMAVRWDSITLGAETVRNILYDALSRPLMMDRRVQLQAQVEFIRIAAADPKLDVLFLSPGGDERQDALTVETPIDPNADISEFVRELSQMYLDDPDRGTETERAYIGPPTRERTREIGEQLHAIGGKMAMLHAHDVVLAEHGSGAATMLKNSWRGIGNWFR